MRPWPLLAAASLVAPAVTAHASTPVIADAPRTAPADRDHLAVETFIGMGHASSVRAQGEIQNEVTSQLGLALTMTTSHAVVGLLVERPVLSFDLEEDHVGLLAGYDAKVAGPLHLRLLGELGRHGFDNIGAQFLSQSPTGGTTSAELAYAGARLTGSLDTRIGFFAFASLNGRVDLSREDVRVDVQDTGLFPPCAFGCPDGPPAPTTRTETWSLGGTELAATVGAGWKF